MATIEHDLIKDNPQLKKPVLTVLAQFGDTGGKADDKADSEEPLRRNELEQALAQTWDPAWGRSPAVVINILVRRKALVEQVYVNGEPYEGKLEDIQTDESVPDDAEAFSALSITEKGRNLAARHQPCAALRVLFDEHPEYEDVFKAALWACSDESGCSRAELESQINQMPQLKPDAQTGRTRVYPQFFIDSLETAGGIAWQDGAWRATQEGRTFC